MADASHFFTEFLPNKIAAKPNLWESIKNTMVFEITGANTWTLDMREAPGTVVEGAVENPGCTIKVAKADWETIMDKPASAMQMFMMGKLKVTGSTGLAMQLQKILA